MKRVFVFLVWVVVLPVTAHGEVTRGVYGVPSIKDRHPRTYLSQLREAEVNAVFVPADAETISWFKRQGFRVYLSVNAFGGKGAWKKYPDSRPVKADGHLLGSEKDDKGYGGVSPTHPGWRKDRLEHVRKLVKKFGGEDGIDGLWLDFIRYPGLWEVKAPKIPDTCYGKRCLEKFQKDRHISIPEGLSTNEAAQWIKKNKAYEWMTWKKAQISSFVGEVRKVLDSSSRKKPVRLGLFLVPWTKGERGNNLSYLLAQDAFQLSRQADVISPMLYHKMSGKKESWVGAMTRYYKETARSEVWPIIQSVESTAEEFSRVLKYAGQAGAEGVLAYSFKGVKPDMWRSFKAFQRPVNLITNPGLEVKGSAGIPEGWHRGEPGEGDVKKTEYFTKSTDKFPLKEDDPLSSTKTNSIGILAGNDKTGVWYSPLPSCRPGEEYIFRGKLYRNRWENREYPALRIWGQEFYINTHWRTKRFQPIRLYVKCPEERRENTFRFVNQNRGQTFWLTQPSLTRNYVFHQSKGSERYPGFFYPNFFPIGVYGANIDNLEEIKRLAINTVLIGGGGDGLKKTVLKCQQVGLRYVLAAPRDPDRLPVYLDEIARYVRPWDVAFYVNDEPGIHSFPINRADDIYRLIKERFPGAATAMAVVRPQVSRDYRNASDFFMLDQYPVPYMPMTWLSDEMDRAAKDVGRSRLASVIQAFGGEKWKNVGWPRIPTWQEMDSLAFLSVIHGSRGIFFFTYSVIGKSAEGRQKLGRVVGRLNRIYPWLVEKNLDVRVGVEMVSPYRVDPKGRPAVHAALKRRGGQWLLLATNTIGTYVEVVLDLGKGKFRDLGTGKFREVFSQVVFPVIKGGIRAKFGPYETKAFLYSQAVWSKKNVDQSGSKSR